MARDNDSVNSDNEGAPKSTFEIYRAEADSLLRNDEFSKAAKSYTKALEMKENDQHCLVSRSRCYLRMDQTDKALKDVEDSLAGNKDYYKGVLQKAEVLYFKGDFETALVYYHRGNKLRPELTEFRLGIQKAEEAINNSVGDSSIELTCDGDLSYFYQHQEAEKGKKAKKPRGGYTKHKQVQEKKKVERKKSSMDSKTQKKLLGQLYNDVTFLNNMVKDETARIKFLNAVKSFKRINSSKYFWIRLFIEQHTAHKTQNSEEINTLAIEALNFLESRTEFWQQQSPARSNKSGRDSKDSAKERGVQPARYVLNSLEEIDRKQTNGNQEGALKQARQVLKHVDGWTEKDLSNKQEVLANLHSIMGNCHLDLGNIEKALLNHEKDLKIGKSNNLQDAVSRAMDNLGRCYAKKGDYNEAVKIWTEKVPTSQSGLESAWLLHEIGRCYLELGQFADSKKYGEDSLKHSQEIGDNSWMLNASVLVAQSEVKLKDYQGAIDTFERALDYAEVMNNKDAQAAIKKAIADVNNQIVENENDTDRSDAAGTSNNADPGRGSDSDRSSKHSSRSKSPSDHPSERSKASSDHQKKSPDHSPAPSPKSSPKHSPPHSPERSPPHSPTRSSSRHSVHSSARSPAPEEIPEGKEEQVDTQNEDKEKNAE